MPGSGGSGHEGARAVVRRYIDALNAHDPDGVVACVSPDFENEHASLLGRSSTGRDAYRERLPGFLARFAELHYQVDALLVEGDTAAAAYVMTCLVHRGEARRPVRVRGVFWFRLRDGLIAHRIDYWDGLTVEAQLGD